MFSDFASVPAVFNEYLYQLRNAVDRSNFERAANEVIHGTHIFVDGVVEEIFYRPLTDLHPGPALISNYQGASRV